MNAIDFLILALATWRLSNDLAVESGPFQIFFHIRHALPLGGLTACIYCVSFWVGIALYGLWFTPAQPLVVMIGVSGGALMLYRQTGAGHVH